MDFVYCPNGHANRPGTRICAVCRALVVQPVAAPSSPLRRPMPPAPSYSGEIFEAAPVAEAEPAAPAQKRNWLWLWLLFLLGLLGLLALIVLAFVYPVNRTKMEPLSPTVRPIAAVVITTPEPALTNSPPTLEAIEILPPPEEEQIVEEPSPTAAPAVAPLGTIVGVVITPTFTFDPDANMLQNGDFNDDWANGWSSVAAGESSLSEIRAIDGEPGVHALHLEQAGPGYLKVAQRVALTYPVEGLEFQARVLAVGKSGGDAEGRAMLIVQYGGADGEPIGASIWLDDAAEPTGLWDTMVLPSSTMPIARHSLDKGWQTLTIDLGRELADKLPGLSPMDVFQLTVILAVANSDACGPANCRATIDATGLSLMPNLP